MTDQEEIEFRYFVKDPRTGSRVIQRDDGMYCTLIHLRGKWHFFAATKDPVEACHHYKCARMTLYGESWEVACDAFTHHQLATC